jgi:hypothetical protein
MENSKQDKIIAWGLFFLGLGLYLSFLSKAYVFEGLIRAMPIETGRWVHLLPGNYLLYGPLGLVFHTLLYTLGIHQPAVTSLQIMDAILGATGLAVFYRLLRRLGGDPVESAVASLLMGTSLGYWLWSTDAEDYILSTGLLLVTFAALVRYARDKDVDPLLIGVLHGLAILGHIVNTIFAVVVLWFFITANKRRWPRDFARYSAAAGLIAGGAYLAVAVGVRHPDNFDELLRWFAGSAGRGGAAISFGGGFSLANFWEWARMSLHIVGSFQPAYNHPEPWTLARPFLAVAWFLLAVFGLALALRWKTIYRKFPAVVGGCAIWLGVYALVFARWEPWTMVYRVSDLPPLWVLLFLSYRSLSVNRVFWRSAALALTLCLALGNLGAEIYPRSLESNNPHLARMRFVREHTSEQDWVTGDSRQDEIYLPYFAQRRPIVIQRYSGQPELLDSLIGALLTHGQSVIVTSRVLESEEWKLYFKRYRLTVQARDPNGFELYLLNKKHA